jgi:hypothetical protein
VAMRVMVRTTTVVSHTHPTQDAHRAYRLTFVHNIIQCSASELPSSSSLGLSLTAVCVHQRARKELVINLGRQTKRDIKRRRGEQARGRQLGRARRVRVQDGRP